MMKRTYCWGDLTDVSAEKASMEVVQYADVPAEFKVRHTRVRERSSS